MSARPRTRLVLRPLSWYQGVVRPTLSPYGVTLMIAAVIMGTSMAVPWNWYRPPGGVEKLVFGLQAAPWLIGLAVVSAMLGIRLLWRMPNTLLKFGLVVLDFLIFLGLFSHFVDVRGWAWAQNEQPRFEAGFFLGVGSLALVIAATVAVCRSRE
jgi:hypothetical protein